MPLFFMHKKPHLGKDEVAEEDRLGISRKE